MRLALTLALAGTLAACNSDMGRPLPGRAWNRTTETVVVTYRGPNGSTAPYRIEVPPGQIVMLFAPFDSYAKQGCLPGTLLASRGEDVVAEVDQMCADEVWEIGEPGTSPSGSASTTITRSDSARPG
jgi:hypothetical protein